MIAPNGNWLSLLSALGISVALGICAAAYFQFNAPCTDFLEPTPPHETILWLPIIQNTGLTLICALLFFLFAESKLKSIKNDPLSFNHNLPGLITFGEMLVIPISFYFIASAGFLEGRYFC